MSKFNKEDNTLFIQVKKINNVYIVNPKDALKSMYSKVHSMAINGVNIPCETGLDEAYQTSSKPVISLHILSTDTASYKNGSETISVEEYKRRRLALEAKATRDNYDDLCFDMVEDEVEYKRMVKDWKSMPSDKPIKVKVNIEVVYYKNESTIKYIKPVRLVSGDVSADKSDIYVYQPSVRSLVAEAAAKHGYKVVDSELDHSKVSIGEFSFADRNRSELGYAKISGHYLSDRYKSFASKNCVGTLDECMARYDGDVHIAEQIFINDKEYLQGKVEECEKTIKMIKGISE